MVPVAALLAPSPPSRKDEFACESQIIPLNRPIRKHVGKRHAAGLDDFQSPSMEWHIDGNGNTTNVTEVECHRGGGMQRKGDWINV